MKALKDEFRWFINQAKANAYISSDSELCRQAGIKQGTFRDRIKDPGTLKLYELVALDKILNFTDEQILTFYQKLKSQF